MSYKLLQAAARMKGLRPQERCVLVNLADRADRLTKRCYPSVGRIASDMCISQREVHRVLKKLRDSGLVSISGKTHRGTNVYVLNLEIEAGSKDGESVPQGQPDTESLAGSQCHTVSVPLTDWQTNSGSELGLELGKKNLNTSAGKPLLAAHAEEVQGKPSNPNQGEQAPPKSTPPSVPLAPLPTAKDSKLVQAWKAAHAKAGLKCHVDSVDGKKLSMLVKGEGAIPYQQAIEILIPRCVLEWELTCTILGNKYLIWKMGKPMPKWPHAGFLLTHRHEILKICSETAEEREITLFYYGKKKADTQPKDTGHYEPPDWANEWEKP